MKRSKVWKTLTCFVSIVMITASIGFVGCGDTPTELPEPPEIGTHSVTLEWDANPPEQKVLHYYVYYGTQSGVYANRIRVNNYSTTCTIKILFPDVIHYFTATAVNAMGESGYSNEVTWGGG